MEVILDNKLKDIEINYSDDEVVCVMFILGGYLDSYEKGKIIIGFENLDDDIVVFYSGIKMFDGNLVINGGRVIGIIVKLIIVKDVVEKVYENIKKINFEGMYYRIDIGR